MSLLYREVVVVGFSYLLAGIPVGLAAVAGAATPLYRLPAGRLTVLWSRMALVVVASVFVLYRLVPLA